MKNNWWPKQGWVLLVIIALCGAIVYMHRQSFLDTDKVVVDERLYNIGVLLDDSAHDNYWNVSHYNGFEAAAKELGVTIHYKTSVSGHDKEAIRKAGDELIEEGCGQIFAIGFVYSEGIQEFAQKHPEIFFFQCGGMQTAPNMSIYFGRMYQPRYLSGMAAGMRTKTNHIGFVASIPTPQTIRAVNAFTLGVQRVNPQAVVHIRWVNGWNNSQKEVAVTKELLQDYPIDVVTHHQNNSKLLEAARDMGAEGIGYHYSDMNKFPITMLTAVEWDWKEFYIKMIQDCIAGKFSDKAYYLGLNSNTVKLAPIRQGALAKEQIAFIDSVKDSMVAGNWDVFYGPIYSQDDQLMIGEGQNPSDKYLVTDMNWFVKGVEGNIDGTNNGKI